MYSVAFTVIVPIAVALIGWRLVTAGDLESASYAVSYGTVRTAIAQALDKELTADRLQEVLLELKDPMPGNNKDTRVWLPRS